MQTIIKIYKNYTLIFALVMGTLIWFLGHNFTFMNPLKPIFPYLINYLMPILIFFMIFLEVNKSQIRDFIPKKWILWIVLYQIIASSTITLLYKFNFITQNIPLYEGIITCMLTPTATAVAVMSSKLKGNPGSATVYVIISSVLASIMISLLFPIWNPDAKIDFVSTFIKIFLKLSPVIILPLLISFLLRWKAEKIRIKIGEWAKDKSFYIWSFLVSINMVQIAKLLFGNSDPNINEIFYITWALIICVIQFAIGKIIGHLYNDRISAGQCLGQKNTGLSIWIIISFLDINSALVPGAYMIWQNIINSIQLRIKNKKQ